MFGDLPELTDGIMRALLVEEVPNGGPITRAVGRFSMKSEIVTDNFLTGESGRVYYGNHQLRLLRRWDGEEDPEEPHHSDSRSLNMFARNGGSKDQWIIWIQRGFVFWHLFFYRLVHWPGIQTTSQANWVGIAITVVFLLTASEKEDLRQTQPPQAPTQVIQILSDASWVIPLS